MKEKILDLIKEMKTDNCEIYETQSEWDYDEVCGIISGYINKLEIIMKG